MLPGVLLHIEDAQRTLAATDGHRLAVRKLPANGATGLDARLIVPARALAELDPDSPPTRASRRLGLERAGAYSWARAADLTAGVYREVARSG